MRSLLKPGQLTPSSPLWLRVATVLCILLVAVMTTVQACHTHTPSEQTAGSHSSVPNQAPDHCPLCVAMHSTLPATLQAAPEPVLHMQTLEATAANAERLFRWRFQLACRPPPVDQLSA